MAESSATPASDAFLDSLASMISIEDLQGILEAQIHMLGRYEKTNEMLSNFNNLSCQRYEKVSQQFREHTQLLLDMKMDLDSIFRRIRNLKIKLARDYPKAYAAAANDVTPPDLGEDDNKECKSRKNSAQKDSQKYPSSATENVNEKQPKISTFETVHRQNVVLKSVSEQSTQSSRNSTERKDESSAKKTEKVTSDPEYTEERLVQEVLSFGGRIKSSKQHDSDSQD